MKLLTALSLLILPFPAVADNIPEQSKTADYQMLGSLDEYVDYQCSRFSAILCEAFVQNSNNSSLNGFVFIAIDSEYNAFVWSDVKTPNLGACSFYGQMESLFTDLHSQSRITINYVQDGISYPAVMYFERHGDMLRVNQERFNICDNDLFIDDVFVKVATRQAAR